MTITRADVVSTMQVLLTEPDRSNPSQRETGMTTCIYTDEEGNHCFAGDILTRLGAQIPPHGHPNNMSNLFALEREGWDFGVTINEDAFEILKATQYYADNDYTWHHVVTSWNNGEIQTNLEDPFE